MILNVTSVTLDVFRGIFKVTKVISDISDVNDVIPDVTGITSNGHWSDLTCH